MAIALYGTHIATTVEFCDSSKNILESIAESFSHLSNVSQEYETYVRQFSLLGSLEQQKRHWEEFIIFSLLSSLDFGLRGFKD
jgi:hypothetical protein